MVVEQRVLVYFDELVMALTKTYGKTMDTHIYSPRDILSSIQGLRHVDAVSVVRCKDCWKPRKFSDGSLYCPFTQLAVEHDDFCSSGERKDNA